MPQIQVAIVNQSDSVTDAEVRTIVPALQEQVSQHLEAAWRVNATLSFYPKGSQSPAGSWPLFIMDVTDAPADSGYHNADANGPFGRVFVKTAMDANQQWTAVASHELLEMLINPYGNLAGFVPSDDTGNVGVYYDLEICDPVYTESYLIGNVSLSDFVFPEWFASWVAEPDPNKPSLQVDQANRLNGPTKLAPGAIVAASSTGRYTLNGEPSALNAGAARRPSRTIRSLQGRS
jgi:hypothetical protein